MPQSIQAQIELEEIADVKRQIITPATSRTIIGIVQDGLIGSYNLTSPNMRIDWKSAMNIMSYTSMDDFKAFKKGKEYTGHELFSMIIPPKINVRRGEKERELVIRNGILEKGRLTKDLLGSKKKNNLTQLIWDEYGVEPSREFLDNTQRLVNNFNLYNGFTVGIGDATIPREVEEQIHRMFETKDLKVAHMITELENNPDLMDLDLFERTLFAELNVIREDVSKLLMNNLDPDNNFNIMISSGSKGEPANMGQMAGCVGLQAFEGKLIPKKLNRRTLPYFFRDDDRSSSRGLIKRPFLRGMTFPEFFFHNMTGREGLIDQAIKSVTGDTPIIILENGTSKRLMIGDWIDKQLKLNESKVEHHKERDMELLKLNKKTVYIPTSDENGKVSWGEVSAITKHDPGTELYEIKTLGGRKAIVTESNSLLIWNKNEQKFIDMLTPDVVIGDCVPTIMKLYEPPMITEYIDMTKYFPKNKYVYGTDFWIAVNEMNKAMEGRIQIPRRWWSENNGKKFTLPYTKVANLRRATGRLTTQNIKNGFIYPYFGTREHILIPDKFELNENNGLMVGLFLAEGNVDFGSGYIKIANNEPGIQQFVNEWFNKFSINNKENSKTNNLGISEDVRGYSRILCKFLTELVGHGAKNKFVHDEAFTAPDEFIVGVINGYISGDGSVRNGGIRVGSASETLINGISILCSRLGIFGKISKVQKKSNNLRTKDIAPEHMLSIRGNWANIFANKIPLLEKSKNKKLKEIKKLEPHRNFQMQKDVVLDKIVQINKIDATKYPKVYDLTVPSTYNFAIANGLVVKDTAESGYIQRKLIKSMEDAMIRYDNTVRTASNSIIQFIYGDSGADTTKQYEYNMKLIEMNNSDIAQKHRFTKDELGNLTDFNDQDNEDYYRYILDMRDLLRTSQIKTRMNYITINTIYMLPVNLARIIENNRNDVALKSREEELDPRYILDKIEEILDNNNTQLLTMTKADRENRNSIKYQDDRLAKTALSIGLHDSLSPKRCIIEYQMNKAQFDSIVSEVTDNYNKNLAEPGEMVGIVAAQSLGEP